jgi:hypothetical protein
MKQRYLLSLLCAIAMLYYALPQLPFTNGNGSLQQLFAFSWFAFAVIVIGGNLSAILYMKEHQRVNRKERNKGKRESSRRKIRAYH